MAFSLPVGRQVCVRSSKNTINATRLFNNFLEIFLFAFLVAVTYEEIQVLWSILLFLLHVAFGPFLGDI
jgi:hypothetical protein